MSNPMYVCLDCRKGGKSLPPMCSQHRTLCLGTRITVPKHNNKRAWKRIEKGEILWDRRKSRNRKYWTWEKPKKKGQSVWGHLNGRNYKGERPDIDLGG